MNSADWLLKKALYDIRDCALQDSDKMVRKAFCAMRRKVKATNPDAVVTVTFQFKSRCTKQQCFVMRGREDWGRPRGVYSSLFVGDKIRSSAIQSQNH